MGSAMGKKPVHEAGTSRLEQVEPGVLEWQIQAIEEGIKDEELGNLLGHKEVMAGWRKRLEDQMDQGSRQRS